MGSYFSNATEPSRPVVNDVDSRIAQTRIRTIPTKEVRHSRHRLVRWRGMRTTFSFCIPIDRFVMSLEKFDLKKLISCEICFALPRVLENRRCLARAAVILALSRFLWFSIFWACQNFVCASFLWSASPGASLSAHALYFVDSVDCLPVEAASKSGNCASGW